ncbi:hypothetical protein [Nonomuraea turcica]|uniref:hypothetical protein n=1 Tax=Nonomuraea sp. G32 TaxID=3067274 RepID=UPI00273AC4D2|nr:hypothetical protein [Nonomuraea sp. G32]MDP4511014.1 hypothetical protein [Nonomuraea sp. G32]
MSKRKSTVIMMAVASALIPIGTIGVGAPSASAAATSSLSATLEANVSATTICRYKVTATLSRKYYNKYGGSFDGFWTKGQYLSAYSGVTLGLLKTTISHDHGDTYWVTATHVTRTADACSS